MTDKAQPLVVITGPTASGKTSLAVDLAEVYGGEIICADSRSIYKGMDIGTAKPNAQDLSRVVHWGLDLVNPDEYFSAATFKEYAIRAISDIRSRGKIPFLVGGTGLYIDSIIFDYQFGDVADQKERERLNNMSITQLHEYCISNNIQIPENRLNKRYVIRNIERNGSGNSRRDTPIDNAIIVAITTEKDTLRSRIEQRIDQLFKDGVIKEAEVLGEKYGWGGESFKGNVYPLAHLYLQNLITLEEMKLKLITLDWQLAKRQLTWMRRNQFIKWGTIEELRSYLSDRLAKSA